MMTGTITRQTLRSASAVLLLLTGCSAHRMAVNFVSDAVVDGGTAYMADNDPELIREALPFGLKILESLLQASPDHEGLLLAASRGFAAYAFLLQNSSIDSELSRERRERIRNLFLRGRDYALAGLARRHADFATRLRDNPAQALAETDQADAPFVYWAGAALGGAISAVRTDLELLVELPLVGALVHRVIELNESYEHGAAHEFLIAYEANRPGGSSERARRHYRRAVELSSGQRASVHLALAEAVSIKEQNFDEFHRLLSAALTVSEAPLPQFRLVNAIARQRAAWLQKHIEDFFIDSPIPKENSE